MLILNFSLNNIYPIFFKYSITNGANGALRLYSISCNSNIKYLQCFKHSLAPLKRSYSAPCMSALINSGYGIFCCLTNVSSVIVFS